MNKKQFDLIVFDWDGTLLNSTATIVHSIQAAAQDLNLPKPGDSRAAFVIGLSLQEAIQRVFPEQDSTMQARLVERFRAHYTSRHHDLVLFDGVREMLKDLTEAGYFLAIATGASRVGLSRALDNTRLTSVFDATRCADQTFSKPHPAMLQEISRELGQDLNRTVMIGDTSHDMRMAQNAGTAAIAVEYGAHPADHLAEFNPLFSAKSVPELHQWLLQNG